MTKISIVFSVIALALLGACATSDPATPAPAPVVVAPAPAVVTAPPPGTVVVQQPQYVVPAIVAMRPGHGRIESIQPLPTSAATGSGAVKQQRRIGIKMDDGTLQFVDTAAEGLSIGERVELTADGQIKH